MSESTVSETLNREPIVLLSKLLLRESHILLQEPHLLASHLHNILFSEYGGEKWAALLENRACDALADRPWLKLLNPGSATQSDILAVLDHGDTVTALAWSSSLKLLASGGGMDGVIRLWEWPGGKMVHELTKIGIPVTSLSWSMEGSLVSGHSDGAIRIWDSASWQVKLTRRTRAAKQTGNRPLVACSACGSLAIATGEDVFIFEGNSSRARRHHRFHFPISSLAWAPDGGKLAFAAPGLLAGLKGPYAGYWDFSSSQIHMILPGETDTVDAVAWLADGSTIAANGINGTIFLWDMRLGRLQLSYRRV